MQDAQAVLDRLTRAYRVAWAVSKSTNRQPVALTSGIIDQAGKGISPINLPYVSGENLVRVAIHGRLEETDRPSMRPTTIQDFLLRAWSLDRPSSLPPITAVNLKVVNRAAFSDNQMLAIDASVRLQR